MATLKDLALFSTVVGLKTSVLRDAGYLDPILNYDTKLFIDPLLLGRSDNSTIATRGVALFQDHYAKVISLLAVSTARGDVAWRNAQKLLSLNERRETCLGYGNRNVSGSSRDEATLSDLSALEHMLPVITPANAILLRQGPRAGLFLVPKLVPDTKGAGGSTRHEMNERSLESPGNLHLMASGEKGRDNGARFSKPPPSASRPSRRIKRLARHLASYNLKLVPDGYRDPANTVRGQPGLQGLRSLRGSGGRADVRLDGRARLDKDERKIVRRHRYHLAQLKPMGRGLADEVVYVAHTPARIPPLEVCVEGSVGGCRVCPAPHEGPVEEENPVRSQKVSRAGKKRERRLPRRDVDHIQGDHRAKRQHISRSACSDC